MLSFNFTDDDIVYEYNYGTLQDSEPGNEQVDPVASRVRFLPRH